MKYYIGSERPQILSPILAMKGDIQTIELDFSVWAEDNSAVTSVTWTTESGQAAISSASVASSVATATLTTSEAGTSMVKAVATNGSKSIAAYLRVVTKDPQACVTTDYGMLIA
jgi:hypothetical protein